MTSTSKPIDFLFFEHPSYMFLSYNARNLFNKIEELELIIRTPKPLSSSSKKFGASQMKPKVCTTSQIT